MSLIASLKSLTALPSSPGPALLGLHVRLQFLPDADAGDLRAMDERLHAILTVRGLERRGTRRQMSVQSEDRHLTMKDQVDLLLWLIGQCGVQVVEIGPLRADQSELLDRLPTLRAVCGDLDLMPIIWLYRRGRVSAAQVAEMLGGFGLSATLH